MSLSRATASRVFLCSRSATSQSWHRNLPVLLPVALSCGTACATQSGCSQFTQRVTAALPQGFFLNSPASTVQVSMSFLEREFEIAEPVQPERPARVHDDRSIRRLHDG